MNKLILITGVAGFIGFHTANFFLNRGYKVQGIDNINDYYDPNLKKDRLDILKKNKNFKFKKIDISKPAKMERFWKQSGGFTQVIHLAAQPGVTHSLENPYCYINANIMGHTVLLELCRKQSNFLHFVYASSSSIYGNNLGHPSNEEDCTDKPLSIYAATKKSCELITETYVNLYGIRATGLRFFTVYGPWGRPDMALSIFAKNIMLGNKITIFNKGKLKRDFTYIDDIVDGIYKALSNDCHLKNDANLHKIYNLGYGRSIKLRDCLDLLQKHLGKKAKIVFGKMRAGDAVATYADISKSKKELLYSPQNNIEKGIPKFVEWFVKYQKNLKNKRSFFWKCKNYFFWKCKNY